MAILYENEFFDEIRNNNKFFTIFQNCLPFRIIIGKEESRVVATIDKVGTSNRFYDKLIMDEIIFRINICFIHPSYNKMYGDFEIFNLMNNIKFHAVGIDSYYVYYMKYFYKLNDVFKTIRKIGISASYPENVYYIDRSNQLQYLSKIFEIAENDPFLKNPLTLNNLPIKCSNCEFSSMPSYFEDGNYSIPLNLNNYYWHKIPYKKKGDIKVISRIDPNSESFDGFENFDNYENYENYENPIEMDF